MQLKYFIIQVVVLLTAISVNSETECGACEHVVINKRQERMCIRKAKCCEGKISLIEESQKSREKMPSFV
jgi:hypothetical protein